MRSVYLIGAVGMGAVKIGSATDPRGAVGRHQVGSPVRLTLLWSQQAERAYALEAALHVHFAADHMHGEWFNLGMDAASLVRNAYRELDTDRLSLDVPEPDAVLRDAAAIFTDSGAPRLFSDDLVRRMRALPEHGIDYSDLTDMQLKQLVTRSLGPTTAMTIEGKRARGYYAVRVAALTRRTP